MTQTETLSPSPLIAHVLFLDMVGFSRESMQAQGRLLERLNTLVTATRAYVTARGQGTILEVPSGDGMALLFFDDMTAPARCAVELAQTLRADPGDPPLLLRMGMHSGLVQRQRDISGKENVVGEGINVARRVMDFGDAGHLLLTEQYAGWLEQIEEWKPLITPLGEGIAKHGNRLRLFALRDPEGDETHGATFGRSDLPASLADEIANAPTGFVGGAVTPDSRFYVERACDAEMKAALAASESILLIKGPRQVGKTSLLAQGVRWARTHTAGGGRKRRILVTDFQKIGLSQMGSDDTLYRLLAATLARDLKFTYDWASEWDPIFGANLNLETFLRALIDSAPEEPLIWCLDEVDKLFNLPFASDFFGLIRSWHNARSTEPGGPWDRLTMVIAYATEAHLFIRDLNQSPFNVGRRLDLEDFTREQTADLAERYHTGLSGEEVATLHALIGGQPFLTRTALDALAAGRWTFSALLDDAERDDGGGPFGDHLQRILVSVSRLPDVAAYVGRVLAGKASEIAGSDRDAYYRLLAAGIIRRTPDGRIVFRCELYRRYLARQMGTAGDA